MVVRAIGYTRVRTRLNYRTNFFHRRDDGYDNSKNMNLVARGDLDVFELLPVAGAKNYIISALNNASDHQTAIQAEHNNLSIAGETQRRLLGIYHRRLCVHFFNRRDRKIKTQFIVQHRLESEFKIKRLDTFVFSVNDKTETARSLLQFENLAESGHEKPYADSLSFKSYIYRKTPQQPTRDR